MILAALLFAFALQGETITAVTVQGNVLTTDDEIQMMAGVAPGVPLGATTVDEAAARLRASKKFDRVEVLKRYASIADPSQIVLVIIVDEGPVHLERARGSDPPRVVRTRGPRFLYLPILSADDGYGLTYGVRAALPDKLGKQSRVSFPLAWGGEKQAALEVDKLLPTEHLVRLRGGVGVVERTHPYFDADDTRQRVWARVEREFVDGLRIGATGAVEHVSFQNAGDRLIRGGAFVVVDTRLDPFLARNAVYGRAAWEHVSFDGGSGVNTSELDGRGYLGLFKQNILVARVYRADADRPLPPYLKFIFGGAGSVRGFRTGSAVGDTLVTGSLELLVPLTSPLSLGRLGVGAFADAGAIYDKGERLNEQPLQRGVGGSVWFSATFVRVAVAVAHAIDGSTRVHVDATLSY